MRTVSLKQKKLARGFLNYTGYDLIGYQKLIAFYRFLALMSKLTICEDIMASPTQTNVHGIGIVRNAFPITPSDTEELPVVPNGIYVGTGGDITLRTIYSDEDVTYKNLPDASYLPLNVKFVRATGTTASGLVGEL